MSYITELIFKIIIKSIRKIKYHIYIPSFRLRKFILINPSIEPHDLREIFFPDFQLIREQNLGRLVYIGASAGINILNLRERNVVEEIVAVEVNEENKRSLYHNLKNLNANIRLEGVSKKGGLSFFSLSSNMSGSFVERTANQNGRPCNTMSVEYLYDVVVHDNTTLVLNCNGTGKIILEGIGAVKNKPKKILVYFFSQSAGYNRTNLINNLLQYYDRILEDSPYTFFIRKQ